jgi:sugar lactone lactonase YvrE
VNVQFGQLDLVHDVKADLGEGPWWDAGTRTLLWLDLFEGAIHSFQPASGGEVSVNVGQPVGMFALRSGGGLLAAVRDGLGFADLQTGKFELAVPVEAGIPSNRANDGVCDALGRFWWGTMAYDQTPGAGTLYRVEPDLTVVPVIRGTTTSNGIDFSPDDSRMYHADTGTGQITARRFDLAAGMLSDPQVIFTAGASDGLPDGLAVDATGDLWVAMWGGSCVLHLSPDGDVKERISLPVTNVTSVAFGGEDLDEMFITTARRGLTEETLAREPHAGSIFRYSPGVAGLLPHRFAG